MVCRNRFINHSPEDYIIDGFVSNCSTNTTDLISLFDNATGEDEVISIPDDNDVGLPTTHNVEVRDAKVKPE